MISEEFFAFIQRFEALEAKYRELWQRFHNSLPAELLELVFEHLSTLKEHAGSAEAKILALADEITHDVWNEYNIANTMQHRNKKPDIYPILKLKTKAAAKKELQAQLKKIPEKYHQGIEEGFWEGFGYEQNHERFELAVHKKLKEVFTRVYFDDVMELDSDYLLFFDGNLYFLATLWVQDIYKLESTFKQVNAQNE
ncbi:MAG: hypothetical protein CVU09_15505 [Bacteroidetes bacterium HGW-Bacteroidetes-4]|jgi:flagellar biosynthesis/type III secretory pathway protein FliH|nr:MAG: hypothetical protein CVU09_15505 [Bacteroidetes bacterium HGW-Bacteroidetes-4]